MDMTTKYCRRCSTDKPVGEFHVRPNGKPFTYCKVCKRATQKRYRLTVLRVKAPPIEGTNADEFRREPTPQERTFFEAKVNKDAVGCGCWEWTGSIRFPSTSGHGRREYGAFWFDGKTRYAHRVAWHFNGGQQPTHLVIDHICMYGRCVNPDHLRVVTKRVNMLENSLTTLGRKRKAA